MNTELKNAVGATDREAEYDASAKRLLGQKIILAHILVRTVEWKTGFAEHCNDRLGQGTAAA